MQALLFWISISQLKFIPLAVANPYSAHVLNAFWFCKLSQIPAWCRSQLNRPYTFECVHTLGYPDVFIINVTCGHQTLICYKYCQSHLYMPKNCWYYTRHNKIDDHYNNNKHRHIIFSQPKHYFSLILKDIPSQVFKAM